MGRSTSAVDERQSSRFGMTAPTASLAHPSKPRSGRVHVKGFRNCRSTRSCRTTHTGKTHGKAALERTLHVLPPRSLAPTLVLHHIIHKYHSSPTPPNEQLSLRSGGNPSSSPQCLPAPASSSAGPRKLDVQFLHPLRPPSSAQQHHGTYEECAEAYVESVSKPIHNVQTLFLL